MTSDNFFKHWFHSRRRHMSYRTIWQMLHLDPFLLLSLTLLATVGLVILYSASNQDLDVLAKQGMRLGLAFIIMFMLAQIPPRQYQIWIPWVFLITLLLLICVLALGVIGKGAQRWLNLGFMKFQPSELMKLALPLMVAWYLHEKQLPPTKWQLIVIGAIVFIPVLLIAKQPDLSTALIIGSTGISFILLSGISWWIVSGLVVLVGVSAPVLWHFMHDYQRERVLTFLNPERDPLGSGYHIIQSKIAIGSGGIYGKGWLNGTQSHLQFLPEHATDFIFGVCGEEFGLIGGITLLIIYALIIFRGLYISTQAQDTFTRLVGGTLTLTFFAAVFINMGMVMGILPVAGIPLPLVSYGGTSMVTIIAGFGILMSFYTHRKLITT